MKTWIILLRGINVGGNNKLPMADLRESLSHAGLTQITTYIQSGNVVAKVDPAMDKTGIEHAVRQCISADFGYDISVMAISPDHLRRAMADNPWGQDYASPNFMFLYFLQSVPDAPDMETLERLKTDTEKLALKGTVFYVYAGDGAGRSKMFAKIERCLGVAATARNWRTLQKLSAILESGYADA